MIACTRSVCNECADAWFDLWSSVAVTDSLTLAMFVPLKESVFRLGPPEGPRLELVLVRAEPRAGRRLGLDGSGVVLPGWVRSEPFALLFRGPAEQALRQDTYEVEHPALGRFLLFIVPVGFDEAGRYYEAVFA